MAERTRPTEAAARRARAPVWRRRRFWQLVIVIEIVVALTVSYVAEDWALPAPDHHQPLPEITLRGI
jgi:anti-sigma-K factor RskA